MTTIVSLLQLGFVLAAGLELDQGILNVHTGRYLSSGPGLIPLREAATIKSVQSTWTFQETAGGPGWHIINKATQKFLDAADGTTVSTGFLGSRSDSSDNMEWRLVSVPGKQDVFLLFNCGRRKFLGPSHDGAGFTLWDDWRERFGPAFHPVNLNVEWRLTKPFESDVVSPPVTTSLFDKKVVSVADGLYLSPGPGLWTEGLAKQVGQVATWAFTLAPGHPNAMFIVNKGLHSYLDAGSGPITLWHGKTDTDVGDQPENLSWQIIPVPGKTNTYFIINIGREMYLNVEDGRLTLWRDWRKPLTYVGWAPEGLMWELRDV